MRLNARLVKCSGLLLLLLNQEVAHAWYCLKLLSEESHALDMSLGISLRFAEFIRQFVEVWSF